jgi:hypothetical protein
LGGIVLHVFPRNLDRLTVSVMNVSPAQEQRQH